MNVLGISGSLRAGSFNTAALHLAAELAPAGVGFTMADISAIPLYSSDELTRAVPAAVTTLVDPTSSADATATLEYNYSVSGVLKNTIDWVLRKQTRPCRLI